MIPEKRLLFAVLKQMIKDYIKLNPSSGLVTAEFLESEGMDFKRAEDIIFKGIKFRYGTWDLDFDDLCDILDLCPSTIRRKINSNQIDFRE